MKEMGLPLAIFAALSASSCSSPSLDLVNMSIVGTSFKIADPALGAVSNSSRQLLMTTARGLLTFDTEDQVTPALAERWILTEDGLSYIFRIRDAEWTDGSAVTSAEVAQSLKRSLSRSGRHPLRSLFGNISGIFPMTGKVVEIRLKSPEPNLLQLLAQPEMAVTRKGMGTGPFNIHSRREDLIRLRPKPDPSDEIEKATVADDSKDIRLRVESAKRGIARFRAEGINYFTGGTFADLPLARAARIDSARFKVDPAYGLFGLGVSPQSQKLTQEKVRLALSIAIDREALVQRFGVSDWQPAIAILPTALDGTAPPAALQIIQAPIDQRREQARSTLRGSAPLSVSVALPEGPGSRLLFASLAADWKQIGVKAVVVRSGQPADLFLIDEVAAVSSALWYFDRLSCGHGMRCDDQAEAKWSELQKMVDPEKRNALIASTDSAFVSSSTFIPLALPLRWSLVGKGLTGWKESGFALHALDQLR